jgi:tetratricopeptide (TPR) repeat protein
MTLAQGAFAQQKYKQAVEHLEFLLAKNAATSEEGGVLEMLATCYRQLDDPQKERATLEKLFSVSPDALPGLERFIEMEKKEQNWSSVRESAVQALEIQPFSSGLHESIVTACGELDQREQAIDSLVALQAMDPVDVAGLNYQLAQSLAADGQTEAAKSCLVDALLMAPRYRDAHRLLLEITQKQPEGPGDSANHDSKDSAAEDSADDDSATKAPSDEGARGEADAPGSGEATNQ